MGIVIRQSIKSSIVTYVGVIIGTVNVLFLYNKFLSPQQLGLYTALIGFPQVFAAFSNLGTPHVGVRFFSRFSDPDKQHNGFLGYLLLAPLVGFVLFLIAYVGVKSVFQSVYMDNSPLLIQYYWYLPFITFFLLYTSTLETYSKVHLRIVVPTILREIFLKSSNSILALLFGFKFITFDQLINGIILVYFLNICFLLIYIKILGKLYLRFDFSFLKKPIFKEMYMYGLWTILGGATATILPNIEKLMLPAYKGGLNSTAIFFIASSIGMVIAIPRNAIASISEPLLAESWKNNNLAHIEEIYQKSALNLLIVGGFLFLGIWTNIDEVFQIIPNAATYSQGKFVVLMVGLYSVFDMATGLNSEILKNSPYYKYDFGFYIIRFIVLLLVNLIFIPIYSYNGAALAMLVSVVVYNLVKFFFIKHKLQLQPFSLNTVKTILLGVLTYGITLLIPSFEGDIWMSFVNIAIKSICITIVFGGGVLFFRISEDLSRTVESLFRKVIGN